ncbi:MAG: alpha/beta hydrolase [Polyangiales bacterium]
MSIGTRNVRRFALLPALAPVFLLAALSLLSGCKMLGMRTIPLEMLEDRWEKPNSQYVEIDGTRVHYTIDGEGPPILLLHGVMASLHTWDGWVEQLKPHYRIIRVDIPGFGLSEPLESGDYTPEYAVKFFEKMRAKLGIERFHVAGNSLGGFIAWFYAVQYPQRVDKLILIDPASYPQPLPRIVRMASRGLVGFMAQRASPRFIVSRNIREVYGNPDAVTDETIDRYHELLLREGHREAMVSYFKTLRKYAKDDSLVRSVPRIKAPTLLMWGEKDRWVPPSLIERWRADLPNIEVRTYPDGGHIPMEELAEETARDAHAFLSDGAVLEAPTHAPEHADEDDAASDDDAEAAGGRPQLANWE